MLELLNAMLATGPIPPEEQVWGETEGPATIILLAIGTVMTIALVVFFAVLLISALREEKSGRPTAKGSAKAAADQSAEARRDS